MVVKTRCRDKPLHDGVVCQLAVPFNTFLRMSFHVVGPRNNVCTILSSIRATFQLPPAESRVSNMFLYSPGVLFVWFTLALSASPSTRDQETT